MRTLMIFSFLFSMSTPLFSQSIMEEREERARQNRLEQLRAEEVIEEEEARDEVEELGVNPVNPYTRLDPRRQKSLFEEMLELRSTAKPRR